MEDHFVKVLVPVKLNWIPVYRSQTPLRRGQVVTVVFSFRKYHGVVWETDVVPDLALKDIRTAVPAGPGFSDVDERQLGLWKFVADYYMCSPCEVFRTARPLLITRAESPGEIEKRRQRQLERLDSKLQKVEDSLQKRHTETVMARLVRQKDELIAMIQALRESPSSLPVHESTEAGPADAPSSPAQLIAGPGRTDEYARAIRAARSAGGQVLVLTPENSFCSKLYSALSGEFGDALYCMTSLATDASRRRTIAAARGKGDIVVVGTKSSVFLPFRKLSLVIVDEEQDALYKQTDRAPRYNGRDVAIVLAGIHGARLMLGSSFPSLESLYNCLRGRYIKVELPAKAGRLRVIDLGAEKKKGGVSGHFSRKLADAIRAANSPVLLLRGWEKEDELKAEAAWLFPGREFVVCTLNELKSKGCGDVGMIAVIQADALVARDGFRADERALQLIAMLRDMVPEVIVQTKMPGRFDGSRSAEALMAERREFGYPPFTRMINICNDADGSCTDMKLLKRDAALQTRKAELSATMPEGCYADVDPA